MTWTEILYTLLIGPLETFFEMVYFVAMKVVHAPGLCIFVMSMVMNFLLLPLYRRTDAIQEEAIAKEKELKPFADHIKKTFRGDERFMMLQTCYRQHHYKPTDALKGLTPLVLEIPFFMAAYNFLSHLQLLHGVAFGPIRDLSTPDGMLVLGGIAINVLPILMTVINLLSSAIYTKGAPAKTKIQLYGMAGLFLILLYGSPSGLVLYWTLNNLFSLVKNLLMKVRKPMVLLTAVGTPLSLAAALWSFIHFASPFFKLIAAGASLVLLNIPLGLLLSSRRKSAVRQQIPVTAKDHALYFTGCGIMAALLGLLIPSSLIHASPEEFLVMGTDFNPNIYVLHTFFLAAGTFLIWLGLFYALASPKGKRMMTAGIWALCGCAVVNHMFFGKAYGNISYNLVFDQPIYNSIQDSLINLAILAVTAAVIILLLYKKQELLQVIGIAALLAVAVMSGTNIIGAQTTINEKTEQIQNGNYTRDQVFTLSKTGKNVVVIMSDRAIGSFIPYIFQELPAVQEQFAGFTYYPNTLSMGSHTNFGLPSVMGGYEYVPEELDRRAELSLKDKHNEALKVMPVLFNQNGFRTSVADPTYANYDEIPDLSIYDAYPEIRTCITKGRYNVMNEGYRAAMYKRMFYYSVMRSAPPVLHTTVYNNGGYLCVDGGEETFSRTQICHGNLTADGRNSEFEASFGVLERLPEQTLITEEPVNTFQMMCNETAHSPALLQLPGYMLEDHVDNTEFDAANPQRTDSDGNTILMEEPLQVRHYHCNAASYIAIGNWLDYLRKNDVYDNTRIIIVSDHGFGLGLHPEWTLDYTWPEAKEPQEDIMYYNPVLLVKDFDSQEFRTDETFMTNADTPSLAMKDLIDHPVNPFTGKEITADAKQEPLRVYLSSRFKVKENNGNTYLPDPWAEVSGDMFDPDNWDIHYPD